MEEENKPEKTQEKKAEKIKDLERLTTIKLRELALEKFPQIKGVHGMKKEELVEAIKAIEVKLGIREKEEEKKAPRHEIKKKVEKEEKKLLTISEAKAAVKKLKGQRGRALSSEDSKALKEARGEIKKLKRLMRRLKEAS